MAQLSYDIVSGVKHNASLSFVTSTREDNSFWNSDANNTSASLSLNSYWERNLTSFVNLVYYSSDISFNTLDSLTNKYTPLKSEYNYTSLSIGGRYRMLEDKLEITASISPSFGDFERQAFDLVCQYFITPDFSVILQARMYRIPNQSTNSIIGLLTRLNF